LLLYAGVIKIQIRLMGKKAMPVIGSRDRIPGPIGRLCIGKDYSCVFVLVGIIAPYIIVPKIGTLFAFLALWNQGCWSEVWLITSSVIILRPLRCASLIKCLKILMSP